MRIFIYIQLCVFPLHTYKIKTNIFDNLTDICSRDILEIVFCYASNYIIYSYVKKKKNAHVLKVSSRRVF